MTSLFVYGVVIVGALFVLALNYYFRLRVSIISIVCVTAIVLGVVAYAFRDTSCEKSLSINSLVVGTSADFAPFSYVNNGIITGFDIELITEIAKRLNKEITIQNMPFGTLIPSLQLGTIQVIAAGLTATSERAEHVLFTKPYLENDPLVVVSRRDDVINSLDGFKNKVVTVNQGYTADTYVSNNLADVTVLRLPTPADAFLALASKRADAFVAAHRSIQPFFEQHSQEEFHVIEIPDAQENCALAITQSAFQLRDEIEHVLDVIKQDGTLEQLRKKWNV